MNKEKMVNEEGHTYIHIHNKKSSDLPTFSGLFWMKWGSLGGLFLRKWSGFFLKEYPSFPITFFKRHINKNEFLFTVRG